MDDSMSKEAIKGRSSVYGLVLIMSKIGAKLIPVFTKLIKILPKLAKGTLSLKGVGVAGSLGLYSLIFSWQMAVSLVAFLFVHEYGHLWAMQKCGIKTKGIYLIPGFGAAAIAAESWKSSRNEAFIALMGPAVSVLFIALMIALYLVTNNPIFVAIASMMSVINLINLFPINPLDGGRVVKSLLYSFRGSFGFFFSFFSLAIAAVVSHYTGLYLLAFVAVLGIGEAIGDYGLNEHLASLIKTGLRILAGSAFIIFSASLIVSVAAGVWWKIILFSALSLIFGIIILIDAEKSTAKEKLSMIAYPIVIIKDIWRGMVSLFKIRPEHLKRVAQHEKMSKGTILLYSFFYVASLICMIILIMYADSVPGCQLAKEILT